MPTLYYRTRLNVYSDEFTTLTASYDHTVAIPVVNSVPSTEQELDPDDVYYFQQFFDRPSDLIKAGWYFDDSQAYSGQPVNLYLPNAYGFPLPIIGDVYVEIEFISSGAKIRRNLEWRAAGTGTHSLIAADGTVLWTGNFAEVFGHPVNGFYSSSALVALEMEGNRITKLGSLNISARYFSPFGWRQTTSGNVYNDPAWLEFFNEYVTPDAQTDDPYEYGGTSSGRVGGGGSWDNSSVPVDFPALPSVSAADAGFITIFNPTLTQLQNLAAYMWSSAFDVDAVKKIFADPINSILGLSIVPVNVPSTVSKTVKVGGISTGVQMAVADSQYVELDCGSITVNEYWGAYLDYAPYTKVEIYLPYIGARPLSTDDVMGKTIALKYHVDVLSGACIAYVKCGASVLYSFAGQCSTVLPVTGNDWTSAISGAISIAGAIGATVATGGAAAPMLAGVASTAVNSLKPEIQKSGSVSGSSGLMAIQTPYLIITRPRQAIPSGQNHYIGYPSFVTVRMGDLYGYTEVESTHLDGIPCTQAELDEILTLLKGGVLF